MMLNNISTNKNRLSYDQKSPELCIKKCVNICKLFDENVGFISE